MPEVVGHQAMQEVIAGDGAAEQIALDRVAALLAQEIELLDRLDAFGDQADLQRGGAPSLVTRLASIASTMHCEPKRAAASLTNSGF